MPTAVPRSARSRRRSAQPAGAEDEEEVKRGLDADDDDYEADEGIDFRLLEDTDEDGLPAAGLRHRSPARRPAPARPRAAAERARGPDRLPPIAGYRDEGRLTAGVAEPAFARVRRDDARCQPPCARA